MKTNINGKLAAVCMMPWLLLALTYVLSVVMGIEDNRLVKATMVVWAVVSPVIMYAMCSALYEAGVRAVVKTERDNHAAKRG